MRFRLGITLVLIAMACTRPDDDLVETRHGTSLQTVASPKLQAIDSLMWQRPDSALAVLMNYLNDDGRDAARHVSTDESFNNHYANLLLAELLYKNDYEQTNRSELQQAVGYFDSLTVLADTRGGTDTRGVSLRFRPRRDASNASANSGQNIPIAFLDARAHYINGVGYYEHDSVVEACKEYLKALEVMEGRFEEKELNGEKAQFMALTYTHLTLLFSDSYLSEQAIFFGKWAMGYYQKHNAEPWHMAWILNDIGSHYDMMEELDSAEYYYTKAIEVLGDTNTVMFRDIATHSSYLEYKKNPNQADKALYQIKQLLLKSESPEESLARRAVLGEIFYHEMMYDSAWVYLNMVFHASSNKESKKQSAEWLVEICKIQGKSYEIAEIVSFLVPYANINENQGYQKSQLTMLCNSYSQKKVNSQHQRSTTNILRRTLWVIGLFAIVLVVALFFVIVVKNNNKRLKTEKHEVEKRLEAETYSHKMKQASLIGKLRRSNEISKKLKQQEEAKESVRKYDGAKQEEKTSISSYKDFRKESICQKIVLSVQSLDIKTEDKVSMYASRAISTQDYVDFVTAINNHCKNFIPKLREKHPDLTESELRLCPLYLLKIREKEMAVLLQISYQAVGKQVKNIVKKTKMPKEALPSYLIGIAFTI